MAIRETKQEKNESGEKVGPTGAQSTETSRKAKEISAEYVTDL